jgi:hypothetical protein
MNSLKDEMRELVSRVRKLNSLVEEDTHSSLQRALRQAKEIAEIASLLSSMLTTELRDWRAMQWDD